MHSGIVETITKVADIWFCYLD